MKNISYFDEVTVTSFSDKVLAGTLKDGRTVHIARGFKESHHGLEQTFSGQSFPVAIKSDGRCAPDIRVHPYKFKVPVTECVHHEFKLSPNPQVMARPIAAANNAGVSLDLWVGVDDDGAIKGINEYVSDRNQAQAQWGNTLSQLFSDTDFVIQNLSWEWKVSMGNRLYLIIHVTPSNRLLWISGNKLPVRNGASSPLLTGRDLERFILRYYQLKDKKNA